MLFFKTSKQPKMYIMPKQASILPQNSQWSREDKNFVKFT